MIYINWLLLILINSFLLVFLISSLQEREPRAAGIAGASLLVNTAFWLLLIRYQTSPELYWLNLAVFVLIGLFAFVSLLKWMPAPIPRQTQQATPYDERDYMFSRNNLKNHPELAARYYQRYPEKQEIDQKIQSKPEIGQLGHLYYDPYYSPVFDAAFTFLSRTRSATQAEPHPEQKEVDIPTVARVIRETALYYGAVDVGFTPLKPYHIYSHAGRRAETWGQEIHLPHHTAIAIVVPMDIHMMKDAPTLPAILESSRQYVEAFKIACIIAEYLHGFGYAARAHTDGNYQVLCVPIAVDAGLGQLGRLGILMHPIYGPCVRISVVTTNLPLASEKTQTHPANPCITQFCKICKKCADNCPTQSICQEDEPLSRGFTHWSINQETCFSYWKNIGTDCGMCIRVCPYTKPNTPIHQLVRFYISRNPFNQLIALKMDDLFYGRNQKIANKNQSQKIHLKKSQQSTLK